MDLWCQKLPTASQSLDGPKSVKSFSLEAMKPCWGGSPGLVVMGRDSRSKGRGFESRHRILDVHFFTNICCKNCNVCLKDRK